MSDFIKEDKELRDLVGEAGQQALIRIYQKALLVKVKTKEDALVITAAISLSLMLKERGVDWAIGNCYDMMRRLRGGHGDRRALRRAINSFLGLFEET